MHDDRDDRRGPGRPKIYSDDSVDRIRVSQGLGDRLRMDEALRTNMLLRVLQIAHLDEGPAGMKEKINEAMDIVVK